jgi:cell fate regulator YaaT (PSP1 superfamily)
LRYEYDTYEQLQKTFPPLGTQVVTKDGPGRVVGQEILAGQVLVETEARTRILVDLADVVRPGGEPDRPQKSEDSAVPTP